MSVIFGFAGLLGLALFALLWVGFALYALVRWGCLSLVSWINTRRMR